MTELFTSAFFVGNRAYLRSLLEHDAPIIMTANGLLQRSADNPFPFQQDPNFWYLTGIEEPDIILVMDKDREYLIAPGRTAIRELFDGGSTAEQLATRSGIDLVLPEEEGWKQLAKLIKRTQQFATIVAPEAYLESYSMYTNPAKARLASKLKDIRSTVEFIDLRPQLMRMRMIKQAPELAALQKAIAITEQSLHDATLPARLEKMHHEYELEAMVTAGFRRRGATTQGFAPIVASGKNACTIHYVENAGPLGDNELIILDVGAEVSHYSADISRTVVRGKASKRQRAVVEAVNAALEFGLEELRPGVTFREFERKQRQFMGEKLRELGLIKTISDEAIHKYYPHYPHFLGLDVHDMGDATVPLEPGMVITNEPGIYIPEENIGVRIEEDVLITATGHKVLSDGLPRLLL
jgi:Xaa-Pro aminopeptidase